MVSDMKQELRDLKSTLSATFRKGNMLNKGATREGGTTSATSSPSKSSTAKMVSKESALVDRIVSNFQDR